MLRYVGKQFGSYPTDHLEAWYVDSLTDYVNDFIGKFYPIQMPIMNKNAVMPGAGTYPMSND